MINFVLCIGACVLSYVLSLLLYRPSHSPVFRNMSTRGGIAVILSSVLCASLSVLFEFSMGETTFFPVFLWTIGLSLYGLTSHKLNRFWTYLIVCGLSVLLIPQNLALFPGLPWVADRFIAALLWAFSLHVAATLNAVPFVMPKFIRLHLLALIALSSMLLKSLPLAWILGICLFAQIGFNFYARKKPFLRQGKSGIVPAMYLIGFFWLWTIAHAPAGFGGLWLACIVAYSYILGEAAYSFIYRRLFRKEQEPKMLSFFFIQSLQKHLDKSTFVLKFFNFHWFVLVLFAVVIALFKVSLTTLLWPVCLILAFIGLEMVLQLNAFKNNDLKKTSVLSIYPVCKDLAAGCKELYRSFKNK